MRDRATFAAFRTHGVRVRQGPIGITFVPPDLPSDVGSGGDHPAPAHPRVAFAIGRRVGHAVERNKVRRRLRAVLTSLDAGVLPVGAYLVTAQADAVGLTYEELRQHVERALTRINRMHQQAGQ